MTPQVQVDQALGAIHALAWEASSLVGEDVGYWSVTGQEPEYPKTPQVAKAIETAFLQLLNLAEALGLRKLTKVILATYQEAREIDLGKFEWFEEQSAWSYWAGPVKQFADSIAAVYGTTHPSRKGISTDLLSLIQNTQGAITDKRCYTPPKNEADVHDRIEAVLRCVYPDLLRKPPLAKPVASFIPDTGLPSISTLIEYKFMSEDGQAGPIANEILADTRGYAESGWGWIVFVVYETRRFKTVHEWRNLLRSCGVSENVGLILLCGEDPGQKPKALPDPVPAKSTQGKPPRAQAKTKAPTPGQDKPANDTANGGTI